MREGKELEQKEKEKELEQKEEPEQGRMARRISEKEGEQSTHDDGLVRAAARQPAAVRRPLERVDHPGVTLEHLYKTKL